MKTLAQWLEYIERQHPQAIALGLDRVREVFARLDATPRYPVITVGGTNGKGSTTAMLAAILGAAGYRSALYSSPHLLTIDGVEQVLLLNADGATSVEPVEGMPLWEHPWPGFRIVQPAVIAGGDLLISSSDGMGGIATRRISVSHGAGAWNVEERWTSRGLKPYFNDLVVHQGLAFGFDGRILSCIDLETGERKWKGGRYGNGQLVLLQDSDVLLVTSEDGELALVSATPDKYTEIAKMRIFESKTWNHPVIVRDLLLVRNGEEMAAFKLPVVHEDRTSERP